MIVGIEPVVVSLGVVARGRQRYLAQTESSVRVLKWTSHALALI